MSEPFLGGIYSFAFGFAPKGYAMCNGQLLPINQNQALFSLLGTTYGGDGRVNFGLPDLRSRIPNSQGQGFVMGQQSGQEIHTVTQSELPAHTHTLAASTAVATTNVPSGNLYGDEAFNLYGAGPTTPMNPGVVTNVGGSQPHENLQPYLAITWCIALQGIFPSQN
jgi:microcystin-dependent protein